MINKTNKNTTEQKTKGDAGAVCRPVTTSSRGGTVILEKQLKVYAVWYFYIFNTVSAIAGLIITYKVFLIISSKWLSQKCEFVLARIKEGLKSRKMPLTERNTSQNDMNKDLFSHMNRWIHFSFYFTIYDNLAFFFFFFLAYFRNDMGKGSFLLLNVKWNTLSLTGKKNCLLLFYHAPI